MTIETPVVISGFDNHPSNPAAPSWDEQPWRRRANCLGISTEQFYAQEPRLASLAKAVCVRCDVLTECRAFAETQTEMSVLGGETWIERHTPSE